MSEKDDLREILEFGKTKLQEITRRVDKVKIHHM